VRRTVLEPWVGWQTLDLRDTAPLAPTPTDEPELTALTFLVRSDDGRALEVEATLSARGPEQEDQDPSPDGVLFHVHRGEPWAVTFWASEHVGARRQSRAPGLSGGVEVVTLQRQAVLQLPGLVGRVEGPGWARWPSTEGVYCNLGPDPSVIALAPGPCLVAFEREDGRWLQLDLVLQPGETRVLTLP